MNPVWRIANVLLISAVLIVISGICVMCGWLAWPFDQVRAACLIRLRAFK
jgi:hypothetical protein